MRISCTPCSKLPPVCREKGRCVRRCSRPRVGGESCSSVLSKRAAAGRPSVVTKWLLRDESARHSSGFSADAYLGDATPDSHPLNLQAWTSFYRGLPITNTTFFLAMRSECFMCVQPMYRCDLPTFGDPPGSADNATQGESYRLYWRLTRWTFPFLPHPVAR